MGKRIHLLISKNIESKTGVCAHCGPVKIRIKHGIWKCQVAVNEHAGPSRQPHGLTEVEAKHFKYGKSCEICGSNNKLVVDHCHKNLFIRGVLCHKCNMGLGHFNDNARLLLAAAEYLKAKNPPEK